MANDGSVVIRIDGDASGYKKALQNILPETKAGLADIKAGLDMASAAAQNLWNVTAEGVKYTANIEQLQTSFEVMTGSAEKAAEVVSRLRTMGAETPFELADIAGVTQLLMQYGFTADDALDKMKMLGDISQGNAQALESIAMGYAQMSSAQKVNLQDIKQMINGGFNPLQEISERTGESMSSLYERISKGTMTVDEITESMRHATSEGGKFFQSMDKQSQTLNGRLSTLKDNASQLLGSLTEGLSEELRDELLPLADNMVSTLQEAFDERGMEGLLDTATGMLPDLLNMMTGRMEDSIASLGKFAPKAVQSIMRTIPTAIRSGTAVLPQITTALFDTAALVVEELVVMLPDLVPVLISGFENMLGSAFKGISGLIMGMYNGVERLMHEGQTKIANEWFDKEAIAKYSFSVDMTVDTTTAANELSTGIDTIMTNIGSALTDGLPDVETVIATQEDAVKGWAQQAYAKIQEWYDAEIQRLNESGVTGAEYSAQVLQLQTKAEELRSGVQATETGALNFLNSMAGKSTEYVRAHLNELEIIWQNATALAEEIEKLYQYFDSEGGKAAVSVVKSGAEADEETISLALNFTYAGYKVDMQSAEEQYAAARDELNAKFESGDIETKEDYDLQIQEAQAELEAAQAAATAAYEQSAAEILRGIADSEGILAAVEEAGTKLNLSRVLSAAVEDLQGADTIKGQFNDEFIAMLADYMQIDPERLLTNEPIDEIRKALVLWAATLEDDAETTLSEIDNEKLKNAYAAALEAGMFVGTELETDDQIAQFAAIIGGIATDGATQAAPEAQTAGQTILDSVTTAMSGGKDTASGLGKDYADGYIGAIRAQNSLAYLAGYNLAKSTARGTAAGQKSASPSKVARGLGNDFGDGYGIGVQESMVKVAAIAKRMTGGIATAVDIAQSTRVNIPTLQQEIVMANEQYSPRLFINGRELGRVMAADTHSAQNDYNHSIALGVGK